MIYNITSRDNKKIKQVLEVRRRMNKDNCPYFIVEGPHLLEMAIEANLVKEIYTVSPNENWEQFDQYVISESLLEKISNLKSPQGVLAICDKIQSKDLSRDHILYLDNIQDPGNLGTILRSALAFDYTDIILSINSVSQYNDKVITATQGAIFKLNIIKGDIGFLRTYRHEYQLLATSLKSSKNIEQVEVKKKHIIVMGNEAHGVSEDILAISDHNVVIPIKNMESLNVAVATSIMLYILANKEK